jgi:hypothetical protein
MTTCLPGQDNNSIFHAMSRAILPAQMTLQRQPGSYQMGLLVCRNLGVCLDRRGWRLEALRNSLHPRQV